MNEVAGLGVAASWAGHEVGGRIGGLHNVSQYASNPYIYLLRIILTAASSYATTGKAGAKRSWLAARAPATKMNEIRVADNMVMLMVK